MALFRRSNLINDMKLVNQEGYPEKEYSYHLPWKRHQVVFLWVVAVAIVLLTIGAALTYYFVATSSAPSLGGSSVGARALLQTPPNGPTPNWGESLLHGTICLFVIVCLSVCSLVPA
jgi:hypothetical protein